MIKIKKIYITYIYIIQTSKKLVVQLTLLYPTTFQRPEWDQNTVPKDTMSRSAMFMMEEILPHLGCIKPWK